MTKRLQDSVVVITGASSGIGRATALQFARRGASLVLAARREEGLRQVSAECGATERILVIPTDITDERAVLTLASQAIERFGRIDVWVNNAAVTVFGRFEEIPPESFRRVIETNLFGYVHGARAVIPYFREQSSGLLINVASQVARAGQAFTSAYVMSKFAVRAFGECLRQELRGTGIEVCTLLPGSVDTPLFHQAANYTGRAVKPLTPILEAERVAQAIVAMAEHPRPEAFVGGLAHAAALLHDVAPGLYERILRHKVEKDHFQKTPAPATAGNLFEPMPGLASVSGGWTERRPGRGVRVASTSLRCLAAGAAIWMLLRNRHPLRKAAASSVLKLGTVLNR